MQRRIHDFKRVLLRICNAEITILIAHYYRYYSYRYVKNNNSKKLKSGSDECIQYIRAGPA